MKVLLSMAIAICLTVGLVRLTRAQEDISPPVLVNLEIEPRQIDTRFALATIVMTATFEDNLAGFVYGDIYFRPRYSDQFVLASFRDDELIAGTLNNGIFTDTITIPQYSVLTRWSVSHVIVIDRIGNRADFSPTGPSSEAYRQARMAQYYFINGNEYLTYLPSVGISR